ncbi:MAG: patatin-like phospholipase family protein [bacterium]|nr:patatin-like phospholipase family protein [bacterium]
MKQIHELDQNLCREEIVGISYSGGGNRGVVHIGVLRAFLEKKITPTHVVGVSAGAFVAAFHAFDPFTNNSFTDLKVIFSFINRAFIGLSPWQVLSRLLAHGFGTKSLGDSGKIKKFLEERLPFKDFSELKVPLALGATNIETGSDSWFRQGPIIPALLASSATPGIFQPVRIGEKVYIDGGVSDNLPLFELARKTCGTIYAVNAGYAGETKREPKNFLENIIDSRDIAQYQTTRYEVELIKALYPRIKIIPIEPRSGFELSPYDFTPEKTEKVIKESYHATLKLLS